MDENNYFKWTICFPGPQDSLYEEGLFKAVLTFPPDFPQNPPEMKFITEMWHPNSKITLNIVYPDGRVCISILHPPGNDPFNQQEKAEERWRPVLGIEQIMVSVISMLNDPNPDSPANIDAGVQYRNDYQGYKKKVRALVAKSLDDM